ncbi:hypothetical protein AVR91_0203630 [Amycolatopsis keratiniphila subsp. keratiniphila]|uniref:OmpR/PhoB-type domain-containing protein n=1 Tax=Amycolatopsis keratiniphila subsp. keratiniphila TaxID=227715 RepID=A0A1W2M377_9PSEU|nr:hypothetical protein AVR91_0203630 [Amycolatopsis keratiniphila subsp. keratiniphila]
MKLLRPARIELGHRSTAPSAHKVRQVLALLALRAGEVVTINTIIDEIWGDEPPRSAMTTTQTYIYHLRRLFDAVSDSVTGRDLVVTHSPGYVLKLDKSRVDAHQFRTLVTEARVCRDSDPMRALKAVRTALSLVEDAPLVDVVLGRTLATYATNLREDTVNALELRISLDIRRGMNQEVISELRTLTAEHPYREGFYLQLMLALYLSNRRSEALGVYHEIRRTLHADMGVEPSHELSRLQHAILVGETSELPGLTSNDAPVLTHGLTS